MKRNKSNRMFIEKDLVRSRAWLALGGIAPQVYMIFRTKCQCGRQYHGHNWVIANNGQIYFTYREAEKAYGITAPRFCRAIDELIEKGFIDIESTGMGVYKVQTFYRISERWRSYGEPTFVPAKRPQPAISNMGFQKKSSNENVSGYAYENVVPNPLATNGNVVPENRRKM